MKFDVLRKQLLLSLLLASGWVQAADKTLLNASFDPTRELFAEVNRAFGAEWQQQTGETLQFRASHGGSGKQARAVIDGLEADVVTLALAADIDAIAEKGKLLPLNWRSRLPYNSTPYASTIVFLVRKGNPKQIKDWDDLARPGIAVITPNPKTSGGARWNYLAAWTWASKRYRNGAKVMGYMRRLYGNVPVLDAGARAATTTFVERGMGDVLVTWESDALLAMNEADTRARFEIVVPSISIKAEPAVAWVDNNVARHGTRKQAEGFLRFLYTAQGQTIAARHYFRPAAPALVTDKALLARFPQLPQVTIDAAFGGWKQARKVHFSDGGLFDRIQRAGH